MLEMKDFLSMIVGAAIGALGLLPLLNKFGMGPSWFALEFLPVAIIGWILAVGALYLVMNSAIEITNSASIGWISMFLALAILAVGVLPLLKNTFGIGPEFFTLTFLGAFGPMLYNVLFIVEGLFLIISGFAMEI